MKTIKSRILFAVYVALALSLVATSAQSAVIGGAPNVDFSGGSYTLSLFDGDATYTFSDNGAAGLFDDPVDVATGGVALIASSPAIFGGNPTSYFSDPSRAPTIGNGTLLGDYKSFDTPATIANSGVNRYLGLAFAFPDGTRYGYARISGTFLSSFGYETVAGRSIVAGAPATAVPEPSAMAVMAFGLLLLGFGVNRRNRRC